MHITVITPTDMGNTAAHTVTQIYSGLDIVTNKATPEELAEVPHHLLGYVPPTQPYHIVKYQQAALR